jgi:hypothetical protein
VWVTVETPQSQEKARFVSSLKHLSTLEIAKRRKGLVVTAANLITAWLRLYN